MSVSNVLKSLLKAPGMSLVILSSGVLLTGCGAGSADTNVQTEEPGTSNPDTGSNPGTNPGDGSSNPGSGGERTLSLNSQPSNTTIYEGKSHTFSVSVNSSHSTTVYWIHNGKQVGTGTSYTINNANLGHAGNYSCMVTDGTLVANCNNFSLAVNQIVRITDQPTSVLVSEGEKASLSVTATGSGPLSYQWYFGGKPISGANAATLNLTDIKIDDKGQYYCVVANDGSNARSNTVNVDVTAVAVTGTARITWSRPTTRADNSPLNSSEIKSYSLYRSASENGTLEHLVTIDADDELVLDVNELTAGRHWFAMTTIDTNDLESSMSSRFSVEIQ